MSTGYLEAGMIVNTHGVRGEVRILPWADSPVFLTDFERFYIDGKPVRVLSAKVHKSFVIVAFEGVSDINGAIRLKNKTVCVDRGDVVLEDGRHFIADLIGLRAIDSVTGESIGIVADVLSLPSNNVYVIQGSKELLIPAVEDFVIEVNIAEGYIKFRLIEGM